jgi:mitosis inhibitor protein kinase SWE1
MKKINNLSPYIVKFFRAWQEDGHLFSQLEYCPYGTLFDFMNHLPSNEIVPDEFIWTVANEVGSGLHHIHGNNMVHLDIKPKNILIGEDKFLKISDFGLNAEIGSSEDGREGDKAYMAYELLSNHVPTHPSADMFSLGIFLVLL